VDAIQAPVLAREWPRNGLEHVDYCPACGSRARQLLYAGLADRSYLCAPGRWTLFRCDDCSSAYLDPRPDERTAHLAYGTYYDGAAARLPAESASAWRRLRRALRNGYLNSRYGYRLVPASRLGRALVPLFPRHRERADEHVRHLSAPAGKARLLDIGSGEGEFLSDMRALGWWVEGIEPDATAVDVARARGVFVRRGTLGQTSLEPASFDAITLRLVLEHLREPMAALEACRCAMKPGGTLWIATPNLDSAGHGVFREHWIHLQPPRHPVVYTPASLTQLLVRADFELVELRAVRAATWSFRLSAAMARGLPPFEHAPRLPRTLALKAHLSDLRALRRPEVAEVVIAIARAA
jgi:2-polyprenyl-3-methyl-5-hydroxy-6-metoxy-1,4-benzoquinol methylase